MLEKGVKSVLPIVLVLFVSGCIGRGTIVTTDNFCLWFDPIVLTTEEIDSLLSEKSLRQIDAVNSEYDIQCNK
jgi:hypothetical protein